MEDPILQEIRSYRQRRAQQFNYDMKAMLSEARKRESGCGHKVVDLSKQRRTG